MNSNLAQGAYVRTMRDWPDSAVRTALGRWSGPALESARDEAAARRLEMTQPRGLFQRGPRPGASARGDDFYGLS